MGEPRRLAFDEHRIAGFDWTRDGRRIVYASAGSTSGSGGLWAIRASGGMPEQLSVAVENVRGLSIARNGDRLVYVRDVLDDNIWRVPGPNSTETNGVPSRLIASTRTDEEPQFSRNGEKIAFNSTRSGNPEIWICDREGHNAFQLTSFGGPTPGSPRWSPDGRWIAFDCMKDGNYDLYAIGAESRLQRRLTIGPYDSVRPSWSRDGRWVYFSSRRSGEYSIWKTSVQGGAPVPVANTTGGFEAFESPDGKSIYYAKNREPGIWMVPVDGGNATRVLEQGAVGNWSLIDQGICFFNLNEPGGPALRFFSFAEHKASLLRKFSKETRIDTFDTALSATGDGRWIIYTQLDQVASDLMLVENFR
jgi:Tol biopolymer transport system component